MFASPEDGETQAVLLPLRKSRWQKKNDISRVFATCDLENPASVRVMEKVGMKCEGILRRYIVHPNISDEPRDSYMYAIVK